MTIQHRARSVSVFVISVVALSLVLAGPWHSVVMADATSTPETTTEAGSGTLIDTSTTTTSGADTSSNTTGATSTSEETVIEQTQASTTPDAMTSVEDPQAATTTAEQATGGQTANGGTIQTGNAVATSSVDNQLNLSSASPDQPGETNSSTITASSTNDGVLASAATTTAATGDNTASGPGNSLIVTGNAVSTANVINQVNTNVFNSIGLILFLNQLFGGGVDLNSWDLSYFFVGGPGASPSVGPDGQPQCTLLTCLNSSSLNVINTNTATVTNSVIVRSSTGSNAASSTDDATIETGNAYAAANVVNLVNTNIINSSYLLISFNNFGDLTQNITLPSADFFTRLFQKGAATSSMNASDYTVSTNNVAALTGTTTTDAQTGNNVATSSAPCVAAPTTEPVAASSTDPIATSTPDGVSGESCTGENTVVTGSAYAASNSYNQVNTTGVGGTSVFLLFRVSGDWTGTIVGLPPGLKQVIIPDSNEKLIQFVSEGDGTTLSQAEQLLQEYNSSHFAAISTSTASVENNVDVAADTGNNMATTTNGSASIATGNAYASANVVNLVNTNIVGQNWIFGVFNIFGNLSGDIIFGSSPILSVGIAPSPASVAPGGEVTYTFTVKNDGNVDANNVLLQASFDNTLLRFDDAGAFEATTTPTGASWRLGLLRKGETRTHSFTARVGNNFPAGQTANVPMTAAIINDNIANPATSETASGSITVSSPSAPQSAGGSGGAGGGGGGPMASFAPSVWTPDPKISVVKSASTVAAQLPISVDYKVLVKNDPTAGPAYRAVLTDTLYDPTGAIMLQRSWDLDTLQPGDAVELSYSVEFAASTTPGLYRNVASVSGKKNYSSASSWTDIVPAEAATEVTFAGSGEVLGIATSTVSSTELASQVQGGYCAPYLSTYLSRRLRNDSTQVMRLQQFLNTQGANLPVIGVFGPQTQASVRAFQQRSGIRPTSGAVYSLTQSAINELVCNGGKAEALLNAIPSSRPAAAAPAKTSPTASKPKAPTAAKTKAAPSAKKATPKAAPPVEPAVTPTQSSANPFSRWLKGLIPFTSAQSR